MKRHGVSEMQWKVDGNVVKILGKYDNWEDFVVLGEEIENNVFEVESVSLGAIYDFITDMSYMNFDAVDELYLQKLMEKSKVDASGQILKFVHGDTILTAEFGFYRRGSNFEKMIDVLMTSGNGYSWILYLGKNVRSFYKVKISYGERGNGYLRELEEKIKIAKKYNLPCVEELEDEYYSMRNREKNWVLKSIYREASAVWIFKNRKPCCMYIWFNGEVQDIPKTL